MIEPTRQLPTSIKCVHYAILSNCYLLIIKGYYFLKNNNKSDDSNKPIQVDLVSQLEWAWRNVPCYSVIPLLQLRTKLLQYQFLYSDNQHHELENAVSQFCCFHPRNSPLFNAKIKNVPTKLVILTDKVQMKPCGRGTMK